MKKKITRMAMLFGAVLAVLAVFGLLNSNAGAKPENTCGQVLFFCTNPEDCGDPLVYAKIDDTPVWQYHRVCQIYFSNGVEGWNTTVDFEVYIDGVEAYRVRGIGTREAFIQRRGPQFPRIQEAEVLMRRYEFIYLPGLFK